MKNKKRLISLIIIIFVVLATTIFVSYGYMLTIISGNETSKKLTAKGKIFKIQFSDGSETLTSNNTTFLPGATLEKKFTITNTGDDLYYNIVLTDVTNTFTRTNDIVYEIYKDDKLILNSTFPTTDNSLITNLFIEKQEVQNYVLKVKYLNSTENQIADSGKTISGNISFDRITNPIQQLNVYGNNIMTYSEGYTEQSPEHPATLNSLGTLVTDTNDANYGKYKINLSHVNERNILPYPFNWTTRTINGITFTDNGDGSISISGTATSNATFYLWGASKELINGMESGKNITISMNATGGNLNKVFFTVNPLNSNGTMFAGAQMSGSQSPNTKMITNEWVGLNVYIYVPSGTTITNVKMYPQIEIGSTKTDYVPYEIINDYNIYVEDSLKCVGDKCDYIDLINKKIVRQTKSVNVGGWVQYNDSVGKTYPCLYTARAIGRQEGTKILCTHDTQTSYQTIYGSYPHIWAHTHEKWASYLYWGIPYSAIGATTSSTKEEVVAAMNAYQKAQEDNGTPIKIYYILKQTDTSETVNLPDTSLLKDKILTATDDNGVTAYKIEKK